jgi:chromosomal replication initiation ATPase DnaA
MWYLLTNAKMTLSEVGRLFGNRDHTTVIHAKKSVNDSLTSKFDNEYKVHIENLNVIL